MVSGLGTVRLRTQIPWNRTVGRVIRPRWYLPIWKPVLHLLPRYAYLILHGGSLPLHRKPSKLHFISEDLSSPGFRRLFQGQIAIRAQTMSCVGTATDRPVGRFQQVACCQHQETLRKPAGRQRNVNRHLVTVEVSVISSTYKRMQLLNARLYQTGSMPEY